MYPRLLRLAEYLLAQMERFYLRFDDHIQLPEENIDLISTSLAGELAKRL